MLQPLYDSKNIYEIGVDEAGRGPLFGRLYVAAVVLPKIEDEQEHISVKKCAKSNLPITWKNIKDSKKIKSKEKMARCAKFIEKNAVAYSVQYIEHDRIDEINIRQAVFEGMHNCIREVVDKLNTLSENISTKDIFLLVDGNDFKPFRTYMNETEEIVTLPYSTIEGGDNKYLASAAASVLAKHSRDTYILELCQQNPLLEERYALSKNMGYGTKLHLEGIMKYGITQWHRKTYGICKNLSN
jgi:ribonuclease HII